MKKVSLGWQMLASLFWPTGLWAFNRIGKLIHGIVIYIGIIGLVTGVNIGLTELMVNDDVFDGVVLVLVMIFYLTPLLFIKKWSKEYNQKIITTQT